MVAVSASEAMAETAKDPSPVEVSRMAEDIVAGSPVMVATVVLVEAVVAA